MPEIYPSSEDSFFMSEILQKEIPILLKQNPELKFLEIGAGSGINLKTALNSGIKKINMFSCDINSNAVSHCKKLGFNCIYSDLFGNIDGKFDLIVFNPPYLPEHKFDNEPDTTGGKKGSGVINKFLSQAKKHLEKNGKIILLTSSFTKRVNYTGYRKKLLARKKLFFEEIYVWEILRN